MLVEAAEGLRDLIGEDDAAPGVHADLLLDVLDLARQEAPRRSQSLINANAMMRCPHDGSGGAVLQQKILPPGGICSAIS
jgi:hypothetical protein